VDAARAEAARARAEGERLRIGLDLALERARIALKDAMTRVEVSSQAVELATRSADLARARFEEGAALPTQLVDAESELLAARLRNVDARTDRDIAALELRRALGLEPLPASGEKR
jgi:outer membrane protein TolC